VNLRHAAALALVGWYLVLPPISDGKPDTSAPLSSWEQWRSFDTAESCEQARDFKREQMKKYDEPKTGILWSEVFGVYSKCISTDDQRLKETK